MPMSGGMPEPGGMPDMGAMPMPAELAGNATTVDVEGITKLVAKLKKTGDVKKDAAKIVKVLVE